MQVYQTDEQGIWTGESRELPPKGGRHRREIPHEPPELTGTQVAQWRGHVWVVLDAPPPPLPGTPEQVNAERDRRIEFGASFSVAGVADPIPLAGSPADQTIYVFLLGRAERAAEAGITDPVLILRDRANTVHDLTPAQMIDLVTQATSWVQAVMVTSWAMKDATAPFEAGIPHDVTADEHWPQP